MVKYGDPYAEKTRTRKTGLFLAFKNFWSKSFDIDSTTSRREYFFAILSQTIASVAIFIFIALACYWMTGGILNDRTMMPAGATEFYALFWFYPSFVPMFSLIARRLRDSGFPTGLVILSLIPMLGYILMLPLFVFPSKAHRLS